jgi:hypothetical protein
MNASTLFGGRPLLVIYEPTDANLEPRREEIRVRQIKLKDYERGFALIDDEIALAAFCVDPGRDKDWVETLTAESYEELHTVVEEVNAKGFFVYAARRSQQLKADQERTITAMAGMSPEAMRLAYEIGSRSASGHTSPGPRPRPV